MKKIVCLLMSLSFLLSARSDDYIGRNYKIEVKKVDSERVSFSLCKKDKLNIFSCEQLGSENGYTNKQLSIINILEKASVYAKGVALVSGAVVGGAIIMNIGIPAIGTASTAVGLQGSGAFYGGMAAGVTGGVYTAKVLDAWKAISPSHQNKKSNVLTKELIGDIDKFVTDEHILETASLLREVL